VRAGETGQFQAEFRGVPTPRPTWLVSGTEITETKKYHIEIAECATRLSVSDITSDDANVAYTCQLTSAAGQATSTARFVIQGKPPVISIGIHVTVFFRISNMGVSTNPWGSHTSLPLSSLPSPFLSPFRSLFPFHSPPLSLLSLRCRPLKSSYEVWGAPQAPLAGAGAEIEFDLGLEI